MFIRITPTHIEMPDIKLEEGALKRPFIRLGNNDRGAVVASLTVISVPEAINYTEMLLSRTGTEHVPLPDADRDKDLYFVAAFTDGRLLMCTGKSIIPVEPVSLPVVLSPVNLTKEALSLPVRAYELPPKVRLRLSAMDGVAQ